MLPVMQKNFLDFSKFVGFRAFFEKTVFLKNGHGRLQTGAELHPSTIPSFLANLNEEALLKVSSKNIDWFQKYIALKSKIAKTAQFHKENGNRK